MTNKAPVELESRRTVLLLRVGTPLQTCWEEQTGNGAAYAAKLTHRHNSNFQPTTYFPLSCLQQQKKHPGHRTQAAN